jgi:trk system potassium uptake protein
MTRLADLPLIVVLLGIAACATWVPAAHAAALRDYGIAQAFFYAGLLLLVLTAFLALATRDGTRGLRPRRQLAAMATAYLVLPPVMALPLYQAVPDTSFSNAWFEMLSAFTTTGATVYDPVRLSPSIHLWRALVGWMGGFFILLAAWAVLAPLNLGGAEILSARLPGTGARDVTGRGAQDPGQRLSRGLYAFFPVYAGLTLALWVGLLIAGENGVDALIHAMGTLSTSGITGLPGGLAEARAGLLGEAMVLLCLVFAVSRQTWPVHLPGETRGPLARDPELRLALAIVGLVPVVLLLRHYAVDLPDGALETFRGAAAAVWGAIFTTLSFLTTTGYESLYWSSARDWSGLGAPGLILLGLAMLGGGVATTAGGVKLLRVIALLRHGERELERIVHPSSVGGRGETARRLRREGAYMAWIFFMLFAISIAATVAALTLLGVGFERALILGISALTSTGPLAASASPDGLGYAGLGPPVQTILGIAMIVGRLETLAFIALIVPATWRR